MKHLGAWHMKKIPEVIIKYVIFLLKLSILSSTKKYGIMIHFLKTLTKNHKKNSIAFPESQIHHLIL